jgi:energy-coupling factor transporter ATP-binding protein EcfA2
MKARDIRPPELQAGVTSAQPILEARGMSTHFPGVQAVRDLDLYGGEVHLNAGENGAGKSTLMKLVAQLEKPEAGEVRIDGNPRAGPHANTLVAAILDQLGETVGTRRAAAERKTVMAVPAGVATASGVPDASAATSLSTPPSSSQGRTQTAEAVPSAIAGPAAREITGVHALGGSAAPAFAAVRGRIPEASRNAGGGVVVEAGEKRRRSAVAKAPVVGFDQMRSLR